MNDIIYFELDNWFAGRDYPDINPINTWVQKNQFSNDKWCKENKLCVLVGYIDMSVCWCIAAPRSWIEKNCPDLLSDKELVTSKNGTEVKKYKYKATDFLCKPDGDGDVYGHAENWLFLEYKEENFGVTWKPTENDYNEDEEEEE